MREYIQITLAMVAFCDYDLRMSTATQPPPVTPGSFYMVRGVDSLWCAKCVQTGRVVAVGTERGDAAQAALMLGYTQSRGV